MRAVGQSDLHHAARAVLTVPPPERTEFCTLLIWQAHVADKHVKRLRRLHPVWGDGSLRAVAVVYAKVPHLPAIYDGQMQRALATVLEVLAQVENCRKGTKGMTGLQLAS